MRRPCPPEELDRLGLASYADALIDDGRDDLNFLRSRSQERKKEIGMKCGMKEGHAEKFAEMLS